MLAKISSRADYVDEVYRSLLDAITDGTLAPGARVQLLVADAATAQPLGQQFQKVGELAEHQCLVAPGDELQGKLFEFLHLGADDARLVADNHLLSSGMSSDSAGRQHTHPFDPLSTFKLRK